MGRRSRKRSTGTGAARPADPRSRAQRDEARRQRAAAAARAGAPGRRRGGRDRPPAPWGNFPLAELVVLVALALGVVGLIVWGDRGRLMIALAMALGSLAGLEVSIREHFAGFRSHTTLLAGVAGVAAMVLGFLAAGGGVTAWYVGLLGGLLVFAAAFWSLRELFKRRSGGLGFR